MHDKSFLLLLDFKGNHFIFTPQNFEIRHFENALYSTKEPEKRIL